ncbi:hypothetical protein [Burkholderia metallica]|uniref:hypothetical protein n=1 Tax=Burkholderia metallica TaxID=488729 RepID=UPI001453B472|nr:hypothetical protein [Burkholderia metallica]VWB06239.1 cupin [Burkholderia metallica]
MRRRRPYAECVFVLSGTGEAIGRCNLTRFPRGSDAHTTLNTGDLPRVYLVACDLPEPDEHDCQNLGKRLYEARANNVFVDLGTGAPA